MAIIFLIVLGVFLVPAGSILFLTFMGTYSFFFFDFGAIELIFFLILGQLLVLFRPLGKIENFVGIVLKVLSIFLLFAVALSIIFAQLAPLMFIILYLGALMMLFIFVVMLFNVQPNKLAVKAHSVPVFASVAFFSYNVAMLLYKSSENSVNFQNFFYATDAWTIFFFNNFCLNSNNIFISLFTAPNIIFFILLTFVLLSTLILAITIIFLTKPPATATTN